MNLSQVVYLIFLMLQLLQERVAKALDKVTIAEKLRLEEVILYLCFVYHYMPHQAVL